MTVFADSSALVKLYAFEPGSDTVRAIAEPLIVSALARVEVVAALWRKQRIDGHTPEQAAVLVAEFEADYLGSDEDPPRFSVIVAAPQVLDSAATLAATHGLRAYDAVQLASARAARSADPDCATFAVFDNQLRQAAAVEGFRLVP
jgi:predicted nucleic acid-binding protein